ncbi:MAG: aspartate-semialdehyde dehydrogenase [Candidatus Limnocylindrales bacterium]
MTRSFNVAVVGAAGMVGSEMIRTLEQRGFPVHELRPLDVPQLAGTEVRFSGATYGCLEATEANFAGIDIAFFSAGADASLDLAPKAVRQGAVVLDNSSAWRMDPACPLVVPEVNFRDLFWHKGIIANPNCSTIQMDVALKPLHDFARIRRIVVSTYQAASGAGKGGVDELRRQTMEIASGHEITTPQAFRYQLAMNLIPQIDVFDEGDYTKEEWKMVHETAKIMGDPSIRVSATAVRVPIEVGHSESINIETDVKLTVADARRLLSEAPGVCVVDDPTTYTYPMPLQVSGTDAVHVGRIREDFSIDRGLNLWVVADNVRKGAALNAVQIAEQLVVADLVSVG